MGNTRGGLVPARIFEVDSSGNEKGGGVSVQCMFNPFEYTISKSNKYERKSKNKSSVPQVEFKESGPQTLKLNLTFDTYESGDDVSLTTNQMWKFMEPPNQGGSKKVNPPECAFEWGVFRFVAVITQMNQKFTFFLKDGTPVRAVVEVVFTQHKDLNDYPMQNPTSGGGDVERVWRVHATDRLDTIAYQVYGDAGRWRLIAEKNKITDPLALRAGQRLVIPEE